MRLRFPLLATAAGVLLAAATSCSGGGGGGGGGSGDFTLAAGATLTVLQTGTAALHVTITRQGGFSDSVTLSVTGLPTGVIASPASIAGGSTATDVIISASSLAVQRSTANASVTGTAAGNASLSHAATTAVTVNGGHGFLDSEFGTAGIYTHDFGGADAVNAIGLQPVTGRLIAIGDASLDFGVTALDPALGTLDATFAGGGQITTPIGSLADSARALGFYPNGNIVVGGAALVTNSNQFAVAVYDVNGAPLGAFNTTGKVITTVNPGKGAILTSLAVQPNGAIVGAGDTNLGSTHDVALARWTSTGTIDTTFAPANGFEIVDFGGDDHLNAVAIDPSSAKILACGVGGGLPGFLIARFTTTGALDSTFGGAGGVIYNTITSGIEVCNAIAVYADGSVVAAGTAGDGKILVMRFLNDSSLDPTFGSGGFISVNVGTGAATVRSIALDASQNILLAVDGVGPIDADPFVMRLLPDGGTDFTFPEPSLVPSGNGVDHANAITSDPATGFLYAAGAKAGTTTDWLVGKIWP